MSFSSSSSCDMVWGKSGQRGYKKAEEKLALCDLCLFVGTSSIYPSAAFASAAFAA